MGRGGTGSGRVGRGGAGRAVAGAVAAWAVAGDGQWRDRGGPQWGGLWRSARPRPAASWPRSAFTFETAWVLCTKITYLGKEAQSHLFLTLLGAETTRLSGGPRASLLRRPATLHPARLRDRPTRTLKDTPGPRPPFPPSFVSPRGLVLPDNYQFGSKSPGFIRAWTFLGRQTPSGPWGPREGSWGTQSSLGLMLG